MRRTTLLFIALSLISYCQAQKNGPHQKALNSRSDSIDVLNYQINLDMTNIGNQKISGNCVVTFTPKVNGTGTLDLDFEGLFVDSILYNGNHLTYTYSPPLIQITLASLFNIPDTTQVRVFYHGSPQVEPSGWGGFHFSGGYAFNLGVAINADPHAYGRIWFPCFDNFVERSTYEFNITTSGSSRAHCNGELISETTSGANTTRKWVMDEEIPTYLACIAVADYTTVHQSFNGINRSIPVELVAVPADTIDMKNSFIHLDSALHIFENYYGPFEWNKIGFSLVPFNSGAMEHATNITFPRYAANGTLNDETLMAREFAHSWWGNLVTCETASDMWINEGMASYSEHLFLELVYDYERALSTIKNNHKTVLQFIHHREGGFRAIAGVPSQYTYSSHVYNKGASVVHNMRAYMGDSLFFVGLKSIITNYQFQTINSTQFRDELTNSTGINMTDFFNDWVFSPGFSHFEIDSVNTIPNGQNLDATIFVQQKLRGAINYHTNTPLEVTFYDSTWNKYPTSIIASGQFSSSTVSIPFQASFYIINENNQLNQARTDQQEIITNTISNKNYSLALVNSFSVNSIIDSAFLQMEHHWVAPDTIKNNVNNYQISTSRYWSFNGDLPNNFSSSFQLNFDGRVSSGFLDQDLYASSFDTLILLHRENSKFDWTEYPYYTKTRQGFNYGYITVDSLLFGEFTFGNKKRVISTDIAEVENDSDFRIYPNPADETIWIENLTNSAVNELKVFDIKGNLIYQKIIHQKLKINTAEWVPGNYLITISNRRSKGYSQKLIIK
ncbi:MAG: T9SS type A sorting domain-containing protein [Flavobacteriales bacterium]|nr:T9SS type A sorting domain-containing protein [Flavobacteriales bacterium]